MPYYGKYRAIVTEVNKDEEKRGRIRVLCPKVYGKDNSPLCEPCLPYAFDKAGDFVLPKLNDFVWIEFEEGDPEKPIWSGGLWSKENTPVEDYTKADQFRQLEFLGNKISFEKDKVVIKNTEDGSMITLEKGKCTVKCSTVEIDANSSVEVKAGGTMNITATGALTLKGNPIHFNP